MGLFLRGGPRMPTNRTSGRALVALLCLALAGPAAAAAPRITIGPVSGDRSGRLHRQLSEALCGAACAPWSSVSTKGRPDPAKARKRRVAAIVTAARARGHLLVSVFTRARNPARSLSLPLERAGRLRSDELEKLRGGIGAMLGTELGAPPPPPAPPPAAVPPPAPPAAVPPPGPASQPAPQESRAPPPAEYETPAPPFELGLFPCTGCHTEPGNPEPRDLGFHDEVQLRHGPGRWCLDCHDQKNRDVLHLTSGEPLPFGESYRLCGQCHGDKLRDWKVGVHGKRIGRWDGKKTYYLCVQCHNPHSPTFQGVETKEIGGVVMQRPIPTPTKPEPRPRRPEEARR